jgi:integrase
VVKKLRSVVLKGIRYYPLDIPAGFNGNAKRSKRYCSSKSEVSDLKSRIRAWKLNRKHRPDTIELSESDKQWLAYLHAELRPDLGVLPQILSHWKLTAASVRTPCTVSEMVTKYLEYREGDAAPTTLGGMRSRCRRFSATFHSHMVHEITPGDIRAFLDTRKDRTSKRNDYKELSPMLAWAKEQGALVVNPLSEIKRPRGNNEPPPILTVDAFEILLRGADKEFSDLLPFLVLGGLAGLRTCEMLQEREADEVVQWSDFDGWGVLTVRGEVAKQTSREAENRRFVKLNPAIKYWLAPHWKDSGKVVDRSQSSFRERLALLREKTGVEMPDNVLRHSFASYWIAGHRKQGFGELAINLGNSEAMAKRHYVESLHPADGKKWFGIRRESAEP